MQKRTGSLFYTPPPRSKDIKRKRWNWPRIVLKVLKRTCMLIGAMVLFSATLGLISAFTLAGKAAPPLPKDMVLVLELSDGISELGREPTMLDPFPFSRPTIRNIVDTIDRASEDKHVHGLVINMKGGLMNMAHVQELRAAVKRFRSSGKYAYAYSSSYGDAGGLGAYYLASAFEQIWMQPVGMVSVAGISLEMPFARELLDKVGANPQFFQREEYKNAMESMTAKNMSDATRESMVSIIKDMSSHMAKEIADDRGMKGAEFKALVDKGLLTGPEALQGRLIDRLDYADALVEEKRKAFSGDPEDEDLAFVRLERYAYGHKPKGPAFGEERKDIALVYAVGAIGNSDGGQGTVNSDQVATAIATAGKDDDIAAIVVRIDSPGGSPSASETIRHAIVKAKERGKKVIVSMGPVAASGGYWIAAPADHIFALPTTLTGSIGVVMGKFEISGLWDKIGINWDSIRWGENAGLWSMNEPFDAAERKRMNNLIDDVYKDFLIRVAEGRKMTPEQVRKIAKGRAWTGNQAKQVGLVDTLGGLDDALDYTAKEIGLDSRKQLNITQLPRPKSAIEQFAQMLGGQVKMQQRISEQSKWLESFAPVLDRLSAAANADEYGVYDADLETLRAAPSR